LNKITALLSTFNLNMKSRVLGKGDLRGLADQEAAEEEHDAQHRVVFSMLAMCRTTAREGESERLVRCATAGKDHEEEEEAGEEGAAKRSPVLAIRHAGHSVRDTGVEQCDQDRERGSIDSVSARNSALTE